MGNFTFRGINKPYLSVPRGLKLPAWAPVKREIKTVPGKPGGYVSSTEIEVRQIEVPIRIKANGFSHLQELKEDLANWLITDNVEELIFDDEPNRTYFAMVDGGLDMDEIVTTGRGTVVFICPDPYKYGPVNTLEITNPMVVTVEGNEPTPPFFRFNVWSGITGIDIVREDTYMSIGRPEEIGLSVYEEKTRIFMEQFNGALVGWGNTSILPFQGSVTGEGGTTNDHYYAKSYGSGTSWHGPAVQKTFDPITDYLVSAHLYTHAKSTKERGLSDLYMLGEDGSIIGRISAAISGNSMKINILVDFYNGAKKKNVLNLNRAYNSSFFGYVDIQKKGNEFTITVGEQSMLTRDRWKTLRARTWKWTDVNNEFNKKLAAVVPYVAAYSNYAVPYRARVRQITVSRINPQTGDIPTILAPNDVVEIDHKENTIIVNETARMDLKDFGADFFMLNPGDNLLMIEPSNHLTGVIEWRDRFK